MPESATLVKPPFCSVLSPFYSPPFSVGHRALVLGIEWIVQNGVVVKGVCGQAEVGMPNRLTMSTTTTNCRWEQENVVQRVSYQDGANVAHDLLIRLQKLELENTIVKENLNNLQRQVANVNYA